MVNRNLTQSSANDRSGIVMPKVTADYLQILEGPICQVRQQGKGRNSIRVRSPIAAQIGSHDERGARSPTCTSLAFA